MDTGSKHVSFTCQPPRSLNQYSGWQWLAITEGPREVQKLPWNFVNGKGRILCCVCLSLMVIGTQLKTQLKFILTGQKAMNSKTMLISLVEFLKMAFISQIILLFHSSSGITASLGNTSIFSLARCLSGRPDTRWVRQPFLARKLIQCSSGTCKGPGNVVVLFFSLGFGVR